MRNPFRREKKPKVLEQILEELRETNEELRDIGADQRALRRVLVRLAAPNGLLDELDLPDERRCK